MRLLFISESWLGSSGRSLKEAMRRTSISDLDEIDEINEDLYLPKARGRLLRAINKLLLPAYQKELEDVVRKKCRDTRPDVVLVYKGSHINSSVIRTIKEMGLFTVNIFPDLSPHAHGPRLREAMGEYDLVISTKPFHPRLWKGAYGYENECEFIPHGYDPGLHFLGTPSAEFKYDVGLIATWRPEYHALMLDVANLLKDEKLIVAIAGNGWSERAAEFPRNWIFFGEIIGSGYSKWAQRSKIVVAPLGGATVGNGFVQPGDEDSTRTYELAAANCFFIHRRTEYVKSIYNENTEVPLFDSAEELADLIKKFIREDDLRLSMAVRAHKRAIANYSIDGRARQIRAVLDNAIL